MIILASARGASGVGDALASLLATRVLTDAEQAMFNRAFDSQFASYIESKHELMSRVFASVRRNIPADNIIAFSASAVRNALASDSDEEFDSNIGLLLAISSWGYTKLKAMGGSLFTTNCGIGYVELKKLLRMAVEKGTSKASLSILVGIFLVTDRSLQQRVKDLIEAIEYAEVSMMDHATNIISTYANGLSSINGGDIVQLIDVSITYSLKFSERVKTKNRTYEVRSACANYIRSIGIALSATDFPVLTPSLRKSLSSLISCVNYDLTEDRKEHNGRDVYRIKDVKTNLELLVDRYSIAYK